MTACLVDHLNELWREVFLETAISLSAFQNASSKETLMLRPTQIVLLTTSDDFRGEAADCLGFTRSPRRQAR
jgi:hypothetical protein